MPAKKKPKLTDDELSALRVRIHDAMAEQGLSQEGLAKRIGRKVETVKVYLADPAYRTQRQPSEDFLARVERGAGPVAARRGCGPAIQGGAPRLAGPGSGDPRLSRAGGCGAHGPDRPTDRCQ